MERVGNPLGPKRLSLRGDHFTMGRQHGEQVKALSPLIDEAIEERLKEVEGRGYDPLFESLVSETREALLTHSPATADLIRGQADALGYEFATLLRYDLASYLRDDYLTRDVVEDEECTTWAATGSATADGQAMMAKNRDSSAAHLRLQTVSIMAPARGHSYVCVGSAGSPAVYCGGINDAGLAVADTHVTSTGIGPGLPDFAMMMHILETFSTVSSAVDYLASVPRLGRNNLILADAQGEVAVFESGHRSSALYRTMDGSLVSTNHRVSMLQTHFVDLSPAPLRGNTFRRYEKVTAALAEGHGAVDVEFAQALMATHDGPLASVCRHPREDFESATVAGCIFLPAERRMLFCHGLPCQGTYDSFPSSKGGHNR